MIDVLIFLVIAGLLAVVIARLAQPLNLIIAGFIILAIIVIALKLFGVSLFTFFLTIWMIFIVGGLYILRAYVRSGKI